jgi:hypothetical protein
MSVLKSRSLFLLCVWTLCIVAVAPAQVTAKTARPTPARRQQLLVKRINQRALLVYKAFIRQSVRTTTLDCDLNDLLEDLILAADSLTDARFLQHNLVVVMQIASDIEEDLRCGLHPSAILIGWGRLHDDLDQLARMNGIRWSEVLFDEQLIASSHSPLRSPYAQAPD